MRKYVLLVLNALLSSACLFIWSIVVSRFWIEWSGDDPWKLLQRMVFEVGFVLCGGFLLEIYPFAWKGIQFFQGKLIRKCFLLIISILLTNFIFNFITKRSQENQELVNHLATTLNQTHLQKQATVLAPNSDDVQFLLISGGYGPSAEQLFLSGLINMRTAKRISSKSADLEYSHLLVVRNGRVTGRSRLSNTFEIKDHFLFRKVGLEIHFQFKEIKGRWTLVNLE